MLSGGRESGHFVEETESANVSAGGVLFKTDVWSLMPVGTRLYIAIEITSADGQYSHPSRLKTIGRVVRVARRNNTDERAKDGGVRGVAVQFEKALRFST